MASTIQQKLYSSIVSLLTTELNSLANNGRAISAAQGSDATTAADLMGDFEYVATYGTNPSAGGVVDLYLIRSVDGTNYTDGDASTDPPVTSLVGSFPLRAVTTAQRVSINDVPLPPGLWKAEVKNRAGQTTAASGNTLKVRPHSLQSV